MIDLDEAQRIFDAASPGWVAYTLEGTPTTGDSIGFIANLPMVYWDRSQGFLPADARAIGLSRTLVPRMIARIRELEDLVVQMRLERDATR